MDLGSSTPPRIMVDLPERATIFELVMTSPSAGWLVGAVFAPDYRGLTSGLIMRYQDQQWWPIDDPLPRAFLDGIAMVSPDEGWVTGYSHDKSQSYLLRLTDGHWRPVAIPLQPPGGRYYGGIRMRSPDEGWIVVHPPSTRRDPIDSLLLHYRDGTWRPVDVPTPLVSDVAPVGPDDLWLIGNASTRPADSKDSTLAHYQQGQWTTTLAPDRALLDTLHMQSAGAGYALGRQPYPASGNGASLPPAVVLRYDGTAWHPLQTGVDPAAQVLWLCDPEDAWAFVRTPPPLLPERQLINEVITTAQRSAGPIGLPWQSVDWPFTDITHIGALVRAAPGEYWASALYEVPPGGAREDHHWELLHFAEGVWHEYPPRVKPSSKE
jgi:hypothetical protein